MQYFFQNPSDLKKYSSVLPSIGQSDSVTAIRNLNKMLASFYDDGYLAASIDSITGNSDTLLVYISPGIQYKWSRLKNGNLDEGMLSEAGFREKLYDNKPLRPSGISKLNKKILGYCENHGYPFATLNYRNFQFDEKMVTAEVFLTEGQLIRIDRIMRKG